MSSASYSIVADSISMGGGLSTSTGSFSLQDTVGGNAVGVSASSTYQINAGYQAQDNGALSLDLSSNSINFGTLVVGQLATSNITVTVSSNSGYTLSMSDVSGTSLPAVSDGVVDGNVAAGEYGVSVTGTHAVFLNDAPVASNLALASDLLPAFSDPTILTFKVVRGDSSIVGDYSQNITLVASANP